MSKASRTVLYLLGSVVLLLQAVVSGVFVYEMIRSNMVPDILLAIVVLILVLFEVVNILLFYRKAKKKKNKKTGEYISRKKRQKKHRIIAMVIAGIVIILCGFAAYIINKVNDTVDAITNENGQEIEIGVYVMKDSTAQSLTDLIDGTFGMTESYDADNTKAALSDINSNLGKEVTTNSYNSVNEMIDALYGAQTDAIILNRAYEGVLEDQDGYQSFTEDTRVVYTYKIKVEQQKNHMNF